MASIRLPSVPIGLAFAGTLVLAAACATNPKPAAAPAQPPAAPSASAAPPAAPPAPATAVPAASAVPRPAAPAPLLGYVTRDQVRVYDAWKPLFADPYVPDPAAIAAIRTGADGVTVLLIVATWCPDSKREVPRFFAIMDRAGIGESRLTMVGVDRSKKDAEGLTEQWGVTRVPTFIFLRHGREVGRVVERTPAGATLEGEIARVLAPRQ